jgi:hypothetical protein
VQTVCVKLRLNAIGTHEVVETDDYHRGFTLSEHGLDPGNPTLIPRDYYGSIEFRVQSSHPRDPVPRTNIFPSGPVGVDPLALIVTRQNLIENVPKILNFLCGCEIAKPARGIVFRRELGVRSFDHGPGGCVLS